MNDAAHVTAGDKIWDERRLRAATGAAGLALWSWDADTDRITMDARAFELWGLPGKPDISFADLCACIHPADLDTVRAAFTAAHDQGGPFEIDFRIYQSGDIRWISARGQGDEGGRINRVLYGVFLDLTFRKNTEEDREIVTREMHHRIKNLFTLASSLAAIAARNSETKEDMSNDLSRRLRGLAAAHNLILPGFHDQHQSVALEDLLVVLLDAYRAGQTYPQTIAISACRVMVGERAITSVAMLVHELATNSAKYGALSADAGRIDVTIHEEADMVHMVWAEHGGLVADGTAPSGFGSQMVDRVIRQLNGSITRDWREQGLTVTLRMDKTSLGA